MSNDLEIINDILNLHLRPWMTHDSGQKYQQMLQTVNKETYLRQPLYCIDFIRPLTAKTKYYHAIIEQKLIKHLNSVHLSMANAITENEKKFQVHRALNQELKSKLIGVESLILKKNYFFDLIDPKNSNRSNDSTFRDEAYIIQLVKYKLIWLYLEIQDNYLPYLKEDPITEEEIHLTYFTEPFQSLIKTAPDIGLPSATIQTTEITAKKMLTPVERDFRAIKAGILSWNTDILTKIWWMNAIFGKNKLPFLVFLLKQYGYFGRKKLIDLLKNSFQSGFTEASLIRQIIDLELLPKPFSTYIITPPTIQDFFQTHNEFAFLQEHIDLDDMEESIKRLTSKLKVKKEFEKGKVNFMSIHKSKGLQSEYVIINGLVAGIIPNETRGLDTIEAQRRLLFVGMTRAIKHLFMVSTVEWEGRDLRSNNADMQQFKFIFWKKKYHGKTSKFVEEIAS